jgi:peptidoglycan/xylan/chitin deacetylase (PgdA/CDA1 family)
MYHRAATLSSDPHQLCVSPPHLAEQLDVLRRHGRVMRLQDMVAAMCDRALPDRAVAVTFDDGYADNLLSARPLLERYDIPATVFITTGGLAERREFWWDELERLILQPGALPPRLSVSLDGCVYEWNVESTASSPDQSQSDAGWTFEHADDPSPRHGLWRALDRWLRPLPEAGQRTVLDQLANWAGTDLQARSTHRRLSPDELIALAQGDLVEIGAHTVTHPMLARLPVTAQQQEVDCSKASLEEVVGQAVTSFAYPYGSSATYTHDTVTAVRAAGYASACAWPQSCVWQASDVFQLPRVAVRDWDGERFGRELREWFRG